MIYKIIIKLTDTVPALTMTLLLFLHTSLPLVPVIVSLCVDTIIGALSICSATRDVCPSLA